MLVKSQPGKQGILRIIISSRLCSVFLYHLDVLFGNNVLLFCFWQSLLSIQNVSPFSIILTKISFPEIYIFFNNLSATYAQLLKFFHKTKVYSIHNVMIKFCIYPKGEYL